MTYENEWLLAREERYVEDRKENKRDSRKTLEQLGFNVLDEAHKLFYRVQPPHGWTKTQRGYWTDVWDVEGKERITQFTSRAPYLDESFLRILKLS